ncbi:MAG: J domain-containing protein [Wolinella sp.]
MSCVISIENGSISVQIDPDSPLLARVRDYVKRYFYEFYFGRHSIIIYPDLYGDSTHLRHRIGFLERLFERSLEPRIEREALLNHHKKTIKIRIQPLNLALSPRIPTPIIRIYKQTPGHLLIWLDDEPSPYFFHALRSIFLFSLIRVDEVQKRLVLNLHAQSLKDSLRTLLKKRQILGKRFTLVYDETQLFNILNERVKQRQAKEASSLEQIERIREARKRLQILPDELNEATLKERYYRLARETHPDLCENKDTAKERFLAVKEAYELLREVLARESN